MSRNYDETTVLQRSKFFADNRADSPINEIFFATILSVIKDNDRVLDLGTGNGYVLKTICEYFPGKLNLYGNDNSEFMLREAEKQRIPNAVFVLGSNYVLPFPNAYFDVVVAKNVTRFSAKEVYRVLKPGGYFIFREYGKGKGLIEVGALFRHRLIRSRYKSFYDSKLRKNGFHCIESKYIYFQRMFRDVDHIIDCVKSYPFIKDFSDKDEMVIRQNFSGEDIAISADGILLFYRRREDL